MKRKIEKTEDFCDCYVCDVRAGRLAICKECKKEKTTRDLFDGICRECKQRELDCLDWNQESLKYMKMCSNGC